MTKQNSEQCSFKTPIHHSDFCIEFPHDYFFKYFMLFLPFPQISNWFASSDRSVFFLCRQQRCRAIEQQQNNIVFYTLTDLFALPLLYSSSRCLIFFSQIEFCLIKRDKCRLYIYISVFGSFVHCKRVENRKVLRKRIL